MAPSADSILKSPHAIVAVGQKPGTSRRLMGLAALAVVTLATSFVSGEAKATNWGSLMQNDPTSAREYGRNEALRSTNSRLAEVVEIRQVDIKNTRTANFGSIVGAAVGVAATKNIDNSSTRNVARILAGGLGAAAGSKIQQRATVRDGVEITIMEVDNRGNTKLRNVVQDNDQAIRIGDIVTVSGSGSKTRISPLSPAAQARLRGQAVSQEVQFNSIQERRSTQAPQYQDGYRPSTPGYGR